MNDLHLAPPDLRPMGYGELLDRAIRLFRRAWRPLLLIGLIGALPTMLSNLLGNAASPAPSTPSAFLLRAVTGQGPGATAPDSFLFLILDYLLTFLVTGALVVVASQVILGDVPSVKLALRATLRRYFALFGTAILIGLVGGLAGIILMGISFVLPVPFLILPLSIGTVVLLGLFYSFTSQAILLEEYGGGGEAMGRSIDLVRARFWPVLGFFLLLWVGTLLLSFGLNLLVELPATLLRAAGLPATLIHPISSLLGALPATLVAPLMALGQTLLYYDTRIRLEGLDLTPR